MVDNRQSESSILSVAICFIINFWSNLMGHKTRIMYIEDKSNGIVGDARIGRVTFSKTGQSLYYNGKTFKSLNGRGFKTNYYDVETNEKYWISGCKKDGTDALYSNKVEIDEDVWEEYWVEIRNQPEMLNSKSAKISAKYSK
jgi:hypothetical protein